MICFDSGRVMAEDVSKRVSHQEGTRSVSSDTKFTSESGQALWEHEEWLSAAGAVPSNTWKRSTSGCLRIYKIGGTINPADLMTKHVDGRRLTTLCSLLSVKHIGGRPSSAPKLTWDTEYISRACSNDTCSTNGSNRGLCVFCKCI